jgi:hypothetical protein
VGGLLTEPELEDFCLGARRSFRQQSLHFRRQLLRFVDIHLEPDQARLFKPVRSKDQRLLQYGVPHHVPCIGASLTLTETGASMMHTQLLALTGHDKPLHQRMSGQGLLWIIPSKVKMRGPPPWAKHCTPEVLPKILLCKIRKQRVLDEADLCHGVTAAPTHFHLSCARCSDLFNFAGISLVNKSKWTAIKCRACRITTKANLWLCSCNLPWPSCPSHRDAGFLCKRPMAKKSRPKLSLQPLPRGQLGDPNPPSRPPCLNSLRKRINHAEPSTCTIAKRLHVQPTVPLTPVFVSRPAVKRKLLFDPGPKLMVKLQKLQPT